MRFIMGYKSIHIKRFKSFSFQHNSKSYFIYFKSIHIKSTIILKMLLITTITQKHNTSNMSKAIIFYTSYSELPSLTQQGVMFLYYFLFLFLSDLSLYLFSLSFCLPISLFLTELVCDSDLSPSPSFSLSYNLTLVTNVDSGSAKPVKKMRSSLWLVGLRLEFESRSR